MELTTEKLETESPDDEKLSANVRTFRDTGYVVLDNIHERSKAASLREAYDELIECYLGDQGGIETFEGKTSGKNHIGIHPALIAPWSDPEILAHPAVDRVLCELLGDDYQCGYYHTNAAYPGSGIQHIHRDTGPIFTAGEMNVPHPAVSIVLNVPLCDFSEENGSTEVWPGSHLLIDRRAEDSTDLVSRAAKLPSARTNIPAGSVILRDLRMFHRGMPNRSGYVRGMLSIVYVRAFRVTGVLEIPESTWDSWPERVRQIFRNNKLIPDSEAPLRYRNARTSQ